MSPGVPKRLINTCLRTEEMLLPYKISAGKVLLVSSCLSYNDFRPSCLWGRGLNTPHMLAVTLPAKPNRRSNLKLGELFSSAILDRRILPILPSLDTSVPFEVQRSFDFLLLTILTRDLRPVFTGKNMSATPHDASKQSRTPS